MDIPKKSDGLSEISSEESVYELSEDEDIEIITSSDTDEEEKSDKERLVNINDCVIRDTSPVRTEISSESPDNHTKYSEATYSREPRDTNVIKTIDLSVSTIENESGNKDVERSSHHQHTTSNTKSPEFCDNNKKVDKPGTLSENSVSEISESIKDRDSKASDTEQGETDAIMESPMSPEEDIDNDSLVHQSEKNSLANGNHDDNHSPGEDDELERETLRKGELSSVVSLENQECVAKGNISKAEEKPFPAENNASLQQKIHKDSESYEELQAHPMEHVIDEVLDAPNSDDEVKEKEKLVQKNNDTFDNILTLQKIKDIETRECRIVVSDINTDRKITLMSETTIKSNKRCLEDKNSVSQSETNIRTRKIQNYNNVKSSERIQDITDNKKQDKLVKPIDTALDEAEENNKNCKTMRKSVFVTQTNVHNVPSNKKVNEATLRSSGKKRLRGRVRKRRKTSKVSVKRGLESQIRSSKPDTVSTPNNTSVNKQNTEVSNDESPSRQETSNSQKEDEAPKTHLLEKELSQPSNTSNGALKHQEKATNIITYFKPIQNWHKILKLPSGYYTDGLSKLLDTHIYKNALPPYYPCIPPNTSERLVESLETDPNNKWMLEQLSCPGCKDRFLIPKSFFQHLYRKTVLITYTCGPCGNQPMAFYNRCHLRVHVLSHLEIDGTSTVTIADPDTLTVSPLEMETELVEAFNFVHKQHGHEVNQLNKEHFRSNYIRCIECNINVTKNHLKCHFGGARGDTCDQSCADQGNRKNSDVSSFNGSCVSNIDTNFVHECTQCSMILPSKCALLAHMRLHSKCNKNTESDKETESWLPQQPFVCPECGLQFETSSMFRRHVQETCQHEARVPVIVCRICHLKFVKFNRERNKEGNKSDTHHIQIKSSNAPEKTSLSRDMSDSSHQALVDYRSVIAHLYQKHVTLVYRCTACPRAFIKKEAIYEHRIQSHDGNSSSTDDKCDKGKYRAGGGKFQRKSSKMKLKSNISDFTLLYRAAFLKKTNNLFATRKEFENQLKLPISKWQKTFAFQCCGCQCLFQSANELSNHNSRWCQMQSNNWFKSTLFCSQACDNEGKQRLDLCRKQEAEVEQKAKFEKHVDELALLMRCKNNPLCIITQPCDKCDKFTKSFKRDFNNRYNQQIGNTKVRKDGFDESEIDQEITYSQDAADTGQGLRVTRLRRKGVQEFKSSKSQSSDNKKNKKKNDIPSGNILNEVGSCKNVKENLQRVSAPAQNPKTAPEEQNKLSKTNKLEQVVKDTEPKRIAGRIRLRGRNSVCTNPNSTQDDGEQGNLPPLSTSDTQNTEKESLNKNIVPTNSTPKNATSSELNGLKTLETYIETMGIDVPSNKYLLAYNRVGKRALAVGCTVAPENKRNRQDNKKSDVKKKIPTGRNTNTKKSSKNTKCSKGQEEVDKHEENTEGRKHECGVCDFVCSNYNDFQNHIVIHKPKISLSGLALGGLASGLDMLEAANSMDAECTVGYQCKNCGMSFASEPSWKKHLFLLHRIKRPQPSDYCHDLTTINQPVPESRGNKEKLTEEDSNPGELTIDELETVEDVELSHEEKVAFKQRKEAERLFNCGEKIICTICRKIFKTNFELQRHFRSHGLAFLKTST